MRFGARSLLRDSPAAFGSPAGPPEPWRRGSACLRGTSFAVRLAAPEPGSFLVGHHLERAAGSRSAIAARTVTAPPGARHGEFGDFADPQQRQPELQVGGVA